MLGLNRAVARLVVMGLVLAGVLVVAVVTGVGTTTAIAIGIVLAGIAGLAMGVRRPRRRGAAEEIAAMMAPPQAEAEAVNPSRATAVEAMAPLSSAPIDPEANLPRWRRPSLLEARRSDPTRQAPAYRMAMKFTDIDVASYDVRVIRYAVVPILDQPDEILGNRLSALENGDEVQVIGASGAFLEVFCPDGQRGWIHRTTVAQRLAPAPAQAFSLTPQEHEDALQALLSARGLT